MRTFKCKNCKGIFKIEIISYGETNNDAWDLIFCPLCWSEDLVEYEKKSHERKD